ncbi:MAG TPA: hypothetical protein VGL56_09905 [Fimbriimonadaceae bacterium]|jgi:hypothetical protein
MRIQEYIVEEAQKAAEEFFRYATAVPSDKLDWAPEGEGRSVMSMCREIAQTPTWTQQAFDAPPENMDELREAAEDLRTPYECKLEFARRLEGVKSLFLGFSDSDLAKTKWLPYNGGRDHTYLEMMDYPRWNCTYHTGQISYIQILYGDKEMH